MLAPAAGGTLEPVGPSRRDHHRTALFLGALEAFECRLAEPLLQLHRIASHHRTLRRTLQFLVCATPTAAEKAG